MVGTLYFLAFRHNLPIMPYPSLFSFFQSHNILLLARLFSSFVARGLGTLGGEAAGESTAGAILQIHPHTRG